MRRSRDGLRVSRLVYSRCRIGGGELETPGLPSGCVVSVGWRALVCLSVAATGGGLNLFGGNLQVEISGCRLTGNTAVGGAYASGGGLLVSLFSASSLNLRDTTVDLNYAWANGSGGHVRGGGAYLIASELSEIGTIGRWTPVAPMDRATQRLCIVGGSRNLVRRSG